MKFKISLSDVHDGPITCIGWSNTEEVYSAGDDNKIVSWSVSNNQPTKVIQLNQDLYPTDMQFLPRLGGSMGKHGDLILITSADGKFHIFNKVGRIERTIEAHKGAILVGQWSNDGSGFLTGGEDGFIKVWSRSGMLRSTVVSSDNSIYASCWSPNSQSIAYTQGKCVVIKHMAPNTKPLRWKAHEGLILCIAWSTASDTIVTGGEDCKYRVWDSQGRQLFSSSVHDNHITCVAWSPAGDLFSVGSYNTLRLCDQSGWSRSLEKPTTGTIYKMAWSTDGTQLACACANGRIVLAHIVERHCHYMNFSVSVTEKKTITAKNVANDTKEILELPERVIQLSMRYSHLVVTTPSQCYIYNTSNWNTPVIFDLKDGSVIYLSLCEKHMLLVERTSVSIYNYQGRLIASPRWPNMRLDVLRNCNISISADTLIVRDCLDEKLIHVIEISNNKGSQESTINLQHSVQITYIALCQKGPLQCRNAAILDKAKDLYIVNVGSSNKSFQKLAKKIECFQWNSEENLLAAIQDNQLIIWFCPTAAYNSSLLKLCSFIYDGAELSRTPRLSDFVGNSVAIRRQDGSLVNIPIYPFPAMLHRFVQENKWVDALNFCRNINNQILWACLAVLATQSNADVIDIAEEAYSNINHFDKVLYIQDIKSLPTKAQQKAGMYLLGGQILEAESILLHNGMILQAILNYVQLHNWSRALDLAVKHKTHVDTILYLRKQYLDKLNKSENNNKFVTLAESIPIDEEKIKQKLLELQNIKQGVTMN